MAPPTGCSGSAGEPLATTPSIDLECLKDRHWYAFLCSSFITFFTGLLLVLSWRILTWVVCQKKEAAEVLEPGKDEKKLELYAQPADVDVGWVTEAKDWAGELISGQTTTGRILVRDVINKIKTLKYTLLKIEHVFVL